MRRYVITKIRGGWTVTRVAGEYPTPPGLETIAFMFELSQVEQVIAELDAAYETYLKEKAGGTSSAQA